MALNYVSFLEKKSPLVSDSHLIHGTVYLPFIHALKCCSTPFRINYIHELVRCFCLETRHLSPSKIIRQHFLSFFQHPPLASHPLANNIFTSLFSCFSLSFPYVKNNRCTKYQMQQKLY